jgi:hypothetical protein
VRASTAVVLPHGAGPHQRQVGTGLCLRQIHGAGPRAVDQTRHVAVAQLGAARRQQRLDRAVRKQRAEGERQAGRLQHLVAGARDELRQSLAAVLLRMLQPLPARLDELTERLPEARRRRHRTVAPGRRLDVAGPVQGRHHFAHEARVLLEHRRHRIVGRVLAARQLPDFGQAGEFTHHEQHVLHGRGVAHLGSFGCDSGHRSAVEAVALRPER